METATIPVVRNVVDDPRELSVTSIAAFPESADVLEKPEEKEVKAEETTPSAEQEEKTVTPPDPEEAKPTEEETKPEEKPEPDAKKTEPHKETAQERINKAVKKQRTAERELDFERKESTLKDEKIKALEDEVKNLKKAVPPQEKPVRDDFETDDEYIEALTEWKVEDKLKVETEKTSGEVAKENRKQTHDEVFDDLDSRMDKGKEKYSDFDELVLSKDLKISQVMVESILLSDVAEDILYYLGQNPDESAKIAQLSPLKAARELSQIEVKLTAPKPQPKPKKPPSAPEPIVPVETNAIIEKNLEGAKTLREYEALRLGGKK